MGLDKKFLKVECGCMDHDVLMDEDLLDQFLVLKSILDRNLPKLVESDIKILKNICLYVFPDIKPPAIENTNELRGMIEIRLEAKKYYMSDNGETVQNVLNINDAVNSRHGIMVVGPPLSGKTQSIGTFTDTLDKLHKREFNGKYVKFMLLKAKKLGIDVKIIKKEGIEEVMSKEPDLNLESKLKITELER